MGIFNKKKKDEDERNLTFKNTPFLAEFKPKNGYIFHSDYFTIDGYYATILTYHHQAGATDGFGAFWGLNRIPTGLGPKVMTINFEQVSRMGDTWVANHQNTAEGVAQMDANSQAQAGTNKSRHTANRAVEDLEVVAQELTDGASYLNVQNRIIVKAPSLEELDKAVDRIERLYQDRFATLNAAAYNGEQRQELANLFARNERKRGKGFYYTSTEFAGSYSLVTHGLEDAGGEYVGAMTGDVNNSAVLLDVDNFRHHVVVSTEQYNMARGRAHMADMWGSKMSQACLLNNGRVVHIILDGADMDKLGPKFDGITYRIDMSNGDVNMFEMFGDDKDELAIFPAQMQKLILMAEQAYETTDADRSIIRGSLEDIATKFYIDSGMWYDNAKEHRDRLRVVNIPHEEVPKLEKFVSYLDMEYKAIVNKSARDEEKVHALSVLSATFKNLLSNNGDLFNTTTSSSIDGAKTGRRVIYDFSRLMLRGKGVAMAQLVNIIGFAVNNLGNGDLVIVHGSELIDKNVREYVDTQFSKLYDKGGRVAYLYNSIDKAFDDITFSHFDKADYTIFGNMSKTAVNRYEKLLGQAIPPDLKDLITAKDAAVGYIRRGFDNVVFQQDLRLNPVADADKRTRRRARRKARKEDTANE